MIDIDEDDILDLAEESDRFYTEINHTKINIRVASSDFIKKNAKQITKAIKDIASVVDENDPLTILMAFSWDPMSALRPLYEFLIHLENDIKKAEQQVETRKKKLGDFALNHGASSRYAEELQTIETLMASMEGGKER